MVDSPVEELARKRLGRTIKGKWRLDRLIGVGGMAAVYAATHRNGARVAIKMLHPTISASQQIRARFVREGYLANKVDHPGVVRVLDDDIDDSDQSAFLVMDLILGTTLAERAMERLLDAGEVLDVADQVLQVLHAAHGQGIIHRDLKPDNLLVDKDGKIHVLDFGIARLLDDTGASTATKTGTAFGTPGFMAPEQALGRTNLISGRTDLYALGATLFALVCGDFVHAAENPQELLVLVATQPARSLAELAPHMEDEVVHIIDKSTRNVPEERWDSANHMLEAVRTAREKLGVVGVRVMPLSAAANMTPPPPMVQAPMPPMPSPPPISSQGALGGPRERLSNPDVMTVAHTPGEGHAPLAAPSPFAVASPAVEAPRRRTVPLVLAVGGAVLLAVIAVVAATTGRRDYEKKTSAAPPQPALTETAPLSPPSAATAEPDIENLEPDPPSASASGKPLVKYPGKLSPTSKPSAKPSTAPTGKKIDLGY